MAKLNGGLRVIDTWQGVGQDKVTPRASATLSDRQDGGEWKVNFSNGILPPEFRPDALFLDLTVKAMQTKFGIMLTAISWTLAKDK
jgi:hypothetical protein